MSEVEGPAADARPLRLTESVRRALLENNEGFTDTTYYQDKNFREQRDYEIADGDLHVRSRSKTSWADSRRDHSYVADEGTTHRFLRNNLGALNVEGVRERAAEIAPELREARTQAKRAEADARAQQESELAAERDQHALDEGEPSKLSTGTKVFAGVAGAVAAFGLGRMVWNAKVKPWREARRARRESEREAKSDEGWRSLEGQGDSVDADDGSSDLLGPDH